jgi:hypothetical protein
MQELNQWQRTVLLFATCRAGRVVHLPEPRVIRTNALLSLSRGHARTVAVGPILGVARALTHGAFGLHPGSQAARILDGSSTYRPTKPQPVGRATQAPYTKH